MGDREESDVERMQRGEAVGAGFDVVDATLRNLPRILMLLAGVMVLYLIWAFVSSPVGEELGRLVGTLASVLAEMAKHWYLFFLLIIPTVMSLVGRGLDRLGFSAAISQRVIRSATMSRIVRNSSEYRAMEKELREALRDDVLKDAGLTEDTIRNAMRDPSIVFEIDDADAKRRLDERVDRFVRHKSDFMLEVSRELPQQYKSEINNLMSQLQAAGKAVPPALTKAQQLVYADLGPGVTPPGPSPPFPGGGGGNSTGGGRR